MSSAALSHLDAWRMRVPEHEEATDYRDAVKSFCDAHQDEIDQVLELLSDLNKAAHDDGLDRNEFPLASVVDFIDHAYPGFKATDRLCDSRKKVGV